MRVYLHIGVHKTGTTALQDFLAANRKTLAMESFLYPKTGSEEKGLGTGHHLLPRSIRNPAEYGHPWPALKREMHSSGQNVAVLSSEDFSNMGKPQISRIRSHLRDLDVKVVVYLRRQDEFIHGVYCTRVLYQQEMRSVERLASDVPPDYYERILGCYEDAFGLDSLIVRPYERDRLVDGDLVSDFFSLLGMEIPRGLRPAPDSPDLLINRALPRNVINIVRWMRASGVQAESIERLCQVLVSYGYRGRRIEADMLPPSARLELLNKYAKSNAAVARRYLGREDGVLFEDLELPDENEWRQRYEGPHADLIASIEDLHEALGLLTNPGVTLPDRLLVATGDSGPAELVTATVAELTQRPERLDD